MQNAIVKFQDLSLEVEPHSEHEWILESSMVAAGYGISENSLRSTKSRNEVELIEGKHYLLLRIATSGQNRLQVFWTKRGVLRLGFFIKTKRAREFRDWAEDLIIAAAEQQIQFRMPNTFADSLRMLADAKENEERLRSLSEQQQLAIAKQTGIIEYLEPLAMVTKHIEFDEDSVMLGTFAPVIGMGQNQLFERLRNEGILISQGQRYNEPYSKYKHWFELKPCEIKTGPRAGKPYWQTRINGKGQAALIKRYGKKLV